MTASTTTRILVLSYLFPPFAEAEAWCTAKALGLGSGVDVVCAAPPHTVQPDHSLDAYVTRRFGVVRRVSVPGWLVGLPLERAGVLVNAPDAFRLRNRVVRDVAGRLDLSSYDALVSRSQPHSIHLVAESLAAEPDAPPWIACFSDPWTDNPLRHQGRLAQLINRRLQSAVFGRADRLVFTSEEAASSAMAEQPGAISDKASVIPHAFAPSLYPEEIASPRADGELVIRHVGMFYGRRSPEPLVRGVAELLTAHSDLRGSVRLELVGTMPQRFERAAMGLLPGPALRIVPPVDHVTSLAMMRSADVLVAVDAPMDRSVFLPSKLVDYVGARRPIVALSPSGPAANLVRSFGGTVVDPSAPKEQVADALYAQLAASSSEDFGAPEVSAGHTDDAIGARFAALVASTR